VLERRKRPARFTINNLFIFPRRKTLYENEPPPSIFWENNVELLIRRGRNKQSCSLMLEKTICIIADVSPNVKTLGVFLADPVRAKAFLKKYYESCYFLTYGSLNHEELLKFLVR